MGRDKHEEAKRSPQKRRYSRTTTAVADWATIDAEAIRTAIATVAAVGGALRFGYTSDGGAYAVGIYGDGDPYTEYVRPHESVEDVLADISAAFED